MMGGVQDSNFRAPPKILPFWQMSTSRDRKKPQNTEVFGASFGGATRNRTGDEGFADPCLTAWPWRRMLYEKAACVPPCDRGAGNGARTRHLSLGKAALYQMSYSRRWCLRVDLNHRHRDFQSLALPTELPRHSGDPDETRTRDLRRDRAAF